MTANLRIVRRVIVPGALAGLSFLNLAFSSAQQRNNSWPDRCLDAAGVRPGMVIGEVGAGLGSLTFPLAVRVGDTGKIYANDINETELKKIQTRCAEKGVHNIEVVAGGLDDPLFPVSNLDMVIMKNVLHDLEFPLSLLENTAKYMRPDAPLVLIDGDCQDMHPHYYSKAILIQVVEQSRFKLEKSELVNKVPLNNQYVHVFRADPAKEKKIWPAWLQDFRAAMATAEEAERRSPPSPASRLLA